MWGLAFSKYLCGVVHVWKCRDQCEELRAFLTKRHGDEVCRERAEQLRLKEEERRKRQEGELYIHLYQYYRSTFGRVYDLTTIGGLTQWRHNPFVHASCCNEQSKAKKHGHMMGLQLVWRVSIVLKLKQLSDDWLTFNGQIYGCWMPVEQWEVLLTSQVASAWSKTPWTHCCPIPVMLFGFGMFMRACTNELWCYCVVPPLIDHCCIWYWSLQWSIK